MLKIAHMSDLHLLEPSWRLRDASERARLHYLSFGRSLSPERRRTRALAGLRQAAEVGFDHLVLTGDLTEDGHELQFEVLAEVLAESRIPPERITLVCGNHDCYWRDSAWDRAMAGPLAAYAQTSRADEILSLGGVSLLPISTAVHDSVLRSAGWIRPATMSRLRTAADDTKLSGRPLIVLQHHAPRPYALRPLQWIDGLQDTSELLAFLGQHPHVYVLHGHIHRERDSALLPEGSLRVFSCRATVDTMGATRYYLADSWGLAPVPAPLEPSVIGQNQAPLVDPSIALAS